MRAVQVWCAALVRRLARHHFEGPVRVATNAPPRSWLPWGVPPPSRPREVQDPSRQPEGKESTEERKNGDLGLGPAASSPRARRPPSFCRRPAPWSGPVRCAGPISGRSRSWSTTWRRPANHPTWKSRRASTPDESQC